MESKNLGFKAHVNRAKKAHETGDKETAKVHIDKAFYIINNDKKVDEFKLRNTPHYKVFLELRKEYERF